MVSVSSAAAILHSQEDINKECIREIENGLKRFKLEEGLGK